MISSNLDHQRAIQLCRVLHKSLHCIDCYAYKSFRSTRFIAIDMHSVVRIPDPYDRSVFLLNRFATVGNSRKLTFVKSESDDWLLYIPTIAVPGLFVFFLFFFTETSLSGITGRVAVVAWSRSWRVRFVLYFEISILVDAYSWSC